MTTTAPMKLRMKTKIIKTDNTNYDEAIDEAAGLILQGQCVAFPTETVYGLGANALDNEAVLGIFRAKNRDADNPLIAHVASMESVENYAYCTDKAYRIMEKFWPGALTLVLPKKACIAPAVSCGLDTVAVRMPANSVALDLIKRAGVPVAAPSANMSGKPSPTKASHVYSDMNGRIPLILDGGQCALGIESTVLDLTGEIPLILRPGLVTPEQLSAVCGKVEVHSAALAQLKDGEKAASPGMKYKHYAPDAPLYLVTGSNITAKIQELYNDAEKEGKKPCIIAPKTHKNIYTGNVILCGDGSAGNAAHEIYDVLRRCDETDVDIIFAEGYETGGEGLALMNRLLRAAAYKIICSNF